VRDLVAQAIEDAVDVDCHHLPVLVQVELMQGTTLLLTPALLTAI
jgi:hypothetical protein